MAELTERPREYNIPDNFIEEGRIFQGRFRIRYLIEGVVLSLITGSIGLLIMMTHPEMSLEFKISMFAILCGPTMFLGIVGFNGDPISVALKSAIAWFQNKNMMLYNPTPRLLKRDPLLTTINQTSKLDEFFGNIEARRKEKIEQKYQVNIVEGEDYEFAEDQYVDAYTKRKRKSVKSQERDGRQEKEYLIKPQKKQKELKIDVSDDFDADEDIFSGETELSVDDNFVPFGANLKDTEIVVDLDIDNIDFTDKEQETVPVQENQKNDSGSELPNLNDIRQAGSPESVAVQKKEEEDDYDFDEEEVWL